MSITILIPTKNRHLYLNKLLQFYSLSNLKYNLIIIDSSDNKFKLKNLSIIKKYKNLNLKYYYAIGWTTEVMKYVSSRIKTKYCCFAGDDDFVINEGLDKCETFLNKNKKFIGCMGHILLYDIESKQKFIKKYSSINKRDEPNVHDRIKNHIIDYSVLHFSLTRTKDFKAGLKSVAPFKKRYLCPSKHVNDEYILSFSLAALGKFKKIDTLQVVRLVGHQNHVKISYTKELDISLKYMLKKLNLIMKKKYKDKKLSKTFSKSFLQNFRKMVIKKEKKQNQIFYMIKFLKTVKLYYFLKFIKRIYTNSNMNHFNLKYETQLKLFNKVHEL